MPTPEGQQADGKEAARYEAAEESATEETPRQAQTERPEHEGIENPDKNPDQAGGTSAAEGEPGADAG